MTDPRTWRPKFIPAHRRKRDPYRAAQLAPVVPIVANVCECGHPELIHRGECLNYSCGCPAFTAVDRA